MTSELRPASEIANEICGCSDKQQHRRDIVLIETDRQQAVAAEVAQIVAMLEKWIDDTMGQSIDPAYLIKRIQRGEYKETSGE